MSLLLFLLLILLTFVVNSQSQQHQIHTYDVSDSAFQVGYGSSSPCACIFEYDGVQGGVTIESGVNNYKNETNDFVSFESESSYLSTGFASTLICDEECTCEYADVDETNEANPFNPNGTPCNIISTTVGNIPLSPFDGMYDILYDVSGFDEVSYVCPTMLQGDDNGNPYETVKGSFSNQETFTPTETTNSKPLMGIKYTNPKDDDDIIYIKTDESCTCIGSNSCNVIETNAPSQSPSESPTTKPTVITSNAATTTIMFVGKVISKMIILASGRWIDYVFIMIVIQYNSVHIVIYCYIVKKSF